MSRRQTSPRLVPRRMTSPTALPALLFIALSSMISCSTSATSGHQHVHRPTLNDGTASRGNQASAGTAPPPLLPWAFQTTVSASPFGPKCDTTTCKSRSSSISKPPAQALPGGTRNAVGTIPTLGRDAGSSYRVLGHGGQGDASASRGRFLSGFGAAAVAVVATSAVQPRVSFATTARSIEDIKKAVEADFVTGRYYVTGELTPSLYRPDCLFTDPTTRVAGVEKYTNAVKLLFDPDNAQIDLLSLEIKDNTHLFAKWRLQGYLKFPWHPYVAPYTGTTLYTVDSDGLISSHEETWSISALEAARATVTPTAGPPHRPP